jgi:cell division ATPase FtsA
MKGSFLVITIESSYIQATVIRYGSKNELQIAHSVQQPFTIKGSSQHIETEQAMVSALSDVLKKVQLTAGKIGSVHLVLSSPWIISKTKSTYIQFPKAIRIDHTYIEKVVAEEEKEFKKLLPFEVDFVEQKVFETKVNGYHTRIKKPVPAMTLSVSSTLSAMSKRVISKLQNTIDHFFHVQKIFFHSASLLAFISMRHIRPESVSGVFIHIHGECTDITIFNEGVPMHFASVNIGSASITRIFAKSFKISNSVAESRISLFEKEEVTKIEAEKIQPVISKLVDEWRERVIEAIEHLDKNAPETIVVHSSDYISLFKTALQSEKALALSEKIDELYLTGIQLVEFQQ